MLTRIMHRFIATQLGKPHGLFGRLATGRILAWGNAALNRWVIDLLDIQPTDRVLDLGCEPGVALNTVAQQVPRGLAVGFDYAPIMAQQAQHRIRSFIHSGRAGIVQGNAARLPYADATFTIVYGVNVIYFWPDAHIVLQEIRRVLRPGGLVALATRPRERIEYYGFTKDNLQLYSTTELVELVRAAGFSGVQSIMMPSEDEWLGGLCTLGNTSVCSATV